MTVARARREIDSHEFAEWIAYYGLEPLGDERADWHAALITSTLANIWRDPKKRRRPWPLEDFVLRFGERVKQTAQEAEMLMTDWLRRIGAKQRK